MKSSRLSVVIEIATVSRLSCSRAKALPILGVSAAPNCGVMVQSHVRIREQPMSL
jgi:hypothetical protein